MAAEKVLIIEDDADVRENVAEIIEISGYSVETAENGLIGVKKAKSFLPDIIICDVMMPEMDGYGVFYALSKHPVLAKIPFIFLTAKTEERDIRKGMQMGVDDYLKKPFEVSELLETIGVRIEKNKRLSRQYASNSSGFNDLIQHFEPKESWKFLLNPSDAITYEKKDLLFRAGSHPQSVYYLLEGSVKQVYLHQDGKELIEEIVTKNQFFGYEAVMNNTNYFHHAICLEKCRIINIPKASFNKLLQNNNDFKHHLIKILSGNIKRKEENLIETSYGTVRSRVMNALKNLSEKFSSEDIPLSREELAQYIGVATETLIRTLSDFKKEGFIDTKGKRLIIKHEKLNHFSF